MMNCNQRINKRLWILQRQFTKGCDKINNMHRSASSHSCRSKIRTPEHFRIVERRRQILLTREHDRNRNYNSQGKDNSNRQTQVTPFRETGTTFRQGRGFSHRIRSSEQFGNISKWNIDEDASISRPRMTSEDNRKRSTSPLRLLLTNEDKMKFDPYHDPPEEGKAVKRNYLRKGTGVNKAIMLNVLKSKCNQAIADSIYSHTNHPSNAILTEAIKTQVPKGLRDTIGPEEMLKMSNIFTGGTIKASNLHRKVHDFIKKYQESHTMKGEEDDDMTLKSIKRW